MKLELKPNDFDRLTFQNKDFLVSVLHEFAIGMKHSFETRPEKSHRWCRETSELLWASDLLTVYAREVLAEHGLHFSFGAGQCVFSKIIKFI